jgi:hypothetical protein
VARDLHAYREVAVESVFDPRSGSLAIRPMAGQAFAPTMRVQCARSMRDAALYPVGTRVLINAKLTDRLGGRPFLYAYHGDPVHVLSKAQAQAFVVHFRRGRI